MRAPILVHVHVDMFEMHVGDGVESDVLASVSVEVGNFRSQLMSGIEYITRASLADRTKLSEICINGIFSKSSSIFVLMDLELFIPAFYL